IGEDVKVVLQANERVLLGASQVVTVETQPEGIDDGISDKQQNSQDRRQIEQVGEAGLAQLETRTLKTPCGGQRSSSSHGLGGTNRLVSESLPSPPPS